MKTTDKNILVIENDIHLSKILFDFFKEKKFSIHQSSTLEESYSLIENNQFTLIVLDWWLDDGEGIDLIEYIKDVSPITKIIMLTEKNQVKDRIKGLAKGADDYLGKPFSLQELWFRVKNILEKSKMVLGDVYEVDDLVFYPNQGLVVIGKEEIRLRKKESELFHYLFRHQNSIMTREDIIKNVWYGASHIPQKATIDVYMRRIRAKLGSAGKILQTVRGFGYKVEV